MPSIHRCPQCSTVGKVHRSKPRGTHEQVRRFLFPVIDVYRCHNCNWRGWMLRGAASSRSRMVTLLAYGATVLLLVIALIYLVIRFWPRAEFEY